jgi:hypothetical protein
MWQGKVKMVEDDVRPKETRSSLGNQICCFCCFITRPLSAMTVAFFLESRIVTEAILGFTSQGTHLGNLEIAEKNSHYNILAFMPRRRHLNNLEYGDRRGNRKMNLVIFYVVTTTSQKLTSFSCELYTWNCRHDAVIRGRLACSFKFILARCKIMKYICGIIFRSAEEILNI